MNVTKQYRILGIGELLWDEFDDKATLGGAPANFAVMAGRLGNHATILSCVGRDDAGCRAVERLESLPVDIQHLQMDPFHETGRVTVELEKGEPKYTIHENAAWDYMKATSQWMQLARRADAICYGSLAQRSRHSHHTLCTLLAATRQECVRVFDVNLREPFYSHTILRESLELATVAKLNEKEVPITLKLLGLGDAVLSLHQSAEALLAIFPMLQLVAVTRANHGSLLVTRSEWHEHPGVHVQIKDTVGAGDAFSAALTHYLLRGATLAVLNEAGNRWGSWVASCAGAMPAPSIEMKKAIDGAIAGTP